MRGEATFPRLSASGRRPPSAPTLRDVSGDTDHGAHVRERLLAVRASIADACARVGRTPDEVRVIGATKTVPDALVADALDAGLVEFGENHAVALRDRAPRFPQARWHFFGALQGGTARLVADHADEVHTLRPGRGLEVLERRLIARVRRIPVLIEVDLAGRGNATEPDVVAALADRVATSDAFELTGLMCVPAPTGGDAAARRTFAALRGMRDELTRTHPAAVELSMGMSGDFPIAVEEGATMVRLGTVLFGHRD